MPIVTTRSIVLQTYPYGDTSKILRLMTRDLGPRSAIARGAHRPGSRFGGLIEPFAEGFATLYLREGRELHTLSDFDLLRERQRLGLDLSRFAGASVLCELVMRLAPEGRDDRLFEALAGGLDALLEAPPPEASVVALRAIWRTVVTLGFGPDLEGCLVCGRRLGEEEVVFDFAGGGLRCTACGREGRRLDAGELATLRALVDGRGALAHGRGRPAEGRGTPAEGRGARGGGGASARQRRLLADFVRYHMAEGARLRSLEFLEREVV